MIKKTIIVNSAEETRAMGNRLAVFSRAGDILWLHGDLGAGKTEMTKGIAVGLAAQDAVSSPSFALIHEYTGGRLPLYHADLYRLDTISAIDLGLEDYLEGDGLTVVEWGERLPKDFYDDGIDLYLNRVDDQDSREIIIVPRGENAIAWLARTEL
ncbi:MAG: tRNA (adenosine(37)-N6)-threonylcarbamoyltransferase complex ATPase subunit type 1 TsaE [bacterium]